MNTLRRALLGKLNIILFFGATCWSTTQAAGVLDQQQLVYDGGTSARTLTGYSVWQSFTAGAAGTLSEIDMGFFNDMSGSGQLQILEGNGTAGAVLQTLTVPVVGITQPEVTWNTWAVSVPVQAGLQYTFKFTPNAAVLPDPYGVAIGSGNPYSGGAMGLDDPSGSYPTDFDVVFRTFVSAESIPATSFVFNISTRGVVQTGDNAMIAGFIIQNGTQKVIIRVIGPALPVAGKLLDPTLELYDSTGALLETNDNWIDSPNKQAIIDTTIPPSNDLESTILRTLEPGAYTAIVRGANNTVGVALVEVYAWQ